MSKEDLQRQAVIAIGMLNRLRIQKKEIPLRVWVSAYMAAIVYATLESEISYEDFHRDILNMLEYYKDRFRE